MKLKSRSWLTITPLLIVLFLVSPGITQATRNCQQEFEERNKNRTPPKYDPNILYFGYLPDAYPISHTDGYSTDGLNQETFCGQLLKHLKEQLPDKNFKTFELDYAQRFRREQIPATVYLAIGCHSATKTNERAENLKKEQGQFSFPFSTTKTKFLVRNNVLNPSNPDLSSLNNLTIAAIQGTTTVNKIKEQYSWQVKDDYCNRKEIVEALKNDRNIDIYATDEIILKGLLNNHDFLRENFTIISPDQLPPNEELAVIVYDNSLISVANDWIDKEGRNYIKNLEKKLYTNPKNKQFNQNWIYWAIPFIAIAILVLFLGFKYAQRRRFNSVRLEEQNKNLTQEAQEEKTMSESKNPESRKFETIHNYYGPVTGIAHNVERDMIVNPSPKTPAQAAEEIQQLLKQLEQSYPVEMTLEKQEEINVAVRGITKNPAISAKVINALKAGGIEALKELTDNPYVNILLATWEGWKNP